MGAVAVSATNPDIVWAGTGEGTNRNSVAWGDGVYKSVDGGQTWSHMGLEKTLQISKILIDPKNPNVVTVAALGNLWGPNQERGVYRSTDGGVTWERTLFVDENTGAVDLARDPSNPRNLLCAMYQRRRLPWDFISGGPGSGLYRSTDGGKNWHKVTRGIPEGNLGRIGLSYFYKNPRVVTATIEYKGAEKDRPSDNGSVKDYAGGTFRSTDGGESWKRISYVNPRPFYFSIPRQDPQNINRFYIPSDHISYTEDGGKTFRTLGRSVHPDFHAWWIEPTDDNHMIVGCDGGVYQTRDKGKTWEHLNDLAIGQYYAVAFDYRTPYWVYGGLQDNGSWGIPTQTRHGGTAFWDADNVGGGDGFHAQVDPTDWGTVYTESQNGGMIRYDLKNGGARALRPRLEGERLRFNWSTPFILSPHNPRTLYVGANRLMKSVDRGDTWRPISPDLTTNDKDETKAAGSLGVTSDNSGAENHCTIITISESPRKEGLIYVGTDDGQVQVTQDGGETWQNVTANIPGLPANTWCSRVLASKWALGRVYATFDGHRSSDFKPYAFVSEDYGKTWKALSAGLPDGDCLYVITEGEKNPDLLYLGSEKALRYSFDRGATWGRMNTKFPTVAVHDLVVHPRDLDLIVATHGRSLWTIDVSGLEQLSADKMKQDVVLMKPQDVLSLGGGGGQSWDGDGIFLAANSQPGTRIMYYLKSPAKDVKLNIASASGESSDDLTASRDAGLNVIPWNGRIYGRLATGDYRVTLTVDGKVYTTSVSVEGLPADGSGAQNQGDGD